MSRRNSAACKRGAAHFVIFKVGSFFFTGRELLVERREQNSRHAHV